ncbi:MAG: LysR substrate-binding domain-containing protein [Hyphomicrobiales bacterium]
MNHSQLRAFHAVAGEGSFTRAAALLRVSQPTLSGHVKALEEGYGIVLFQRGSREVVLTDFGHALYEVTQRYFASEAEAERLLAQAGGLVSGRLRVIADSPFIMVPLLAPYSRRYPRVELRVQFGNSTDILRSVTGSRSDVGILPKVDPGSRLYLKPFREDRLVVFVDKGHPWSQRRSIRLADISDQVLVQREAGSTTRAIFEDAMRDHGIAPARILEMGSREAVREAVAAGLGIGVVNESEFGYDTRLHKLAVSDVTLNVTECAICRDDSRDNAAVAAFLDLIGEMSDLAHATAA